MYNERNGYCYCGCGEFAPLVKKTQTKLGHTKGQSLKFVRGHENITTQGMEGPNPSGLCMCGCSQKTELATATNTKQNAVKGQPFRFIKGHQCIKNIVRIPRNPSGLCMCGCKEPAPISNRTDDSAGRIKGQAMCFIKGHSSFRPFPERFWKKVDKNGPIPSDPKVLALYPEIANTNCWLFTGCLNSDGYGHTSLEGSPISAHRLAWFVETGEWPTPEACHKCDVPACVRFEHLFEGTHTENVHDMINKGRKHTVLTAEQVQDIRDVLSNNVRGDVARMAEKHNVSHATVSHINTGKTWKHIKAA